MKTRSTFFLDILEIKKIDFNSRKMKKEINAIREANKQLIENSKIDRRNLHLTFDI